MTTCIDWIIKLQLEQKNHYTTIRRIMVWEINSGNSSIRERDIECKQIEREITTHRRSVLNLDTKKRDVVEMGQAIHISFLITFSGNARRLKSGEVALRNYSSLTKCPRETVHISKRNSTEKSRNITFIIQFYIFIKIKGCEKIRFGASTDTFLLGHVHVLSFYSSCEVWVDMWHW